MSKPLLSFVSELTAGEAMPSAAGPLARLAARLTGGHWDRWLCDLGLDFPLQLEKVWLPNSVQQNHEGLYRTQRIIRTSPQLNY